MIFLKAKFWQQLFPWLQQSQTKPLHFQDLKIIYIIIIITAFFVYIIFPFKILSFLNCLF